MDTLLTYLHNPSTLPINNNVLKLSILNSGHTEYISFLYIFLYNLYVFTTPDGSCWSYISQSHHLPGVTGFHECKEYTCSSGNWIETGVTNADCINNSKLLKPYIEICLN